MPTMIPPMNALKVFDAVARFKNMTKAAETLHVTQSAASQQIKLLEEYLKVALISRANGRLTLTPAGANYAEKINHAFENIRNATYALRTYCLKDKRISLSAPTSFAMRWLFKRLPEFYRRYPQYDLSITTPFKIIDFDHEDFDAAIYYGDGHWGESLVTVKLVEDEIFPVCGPLYLAELQKNGTPELQDHTFIKIDCILFKWADWFKRAKLAMPKKSHTLKVSNLEQGLTAALNNLGVTLTHKSLVEEDLDQGRLVMPFNYRLLTDCSYYFVFPQKYQNCEKIILLQDWLLSQIAPAA